MSQDTQIIQNLINTAPARRGMYARTIYLEDRDYLFDQAVIVDKSVRIVGNNTRIILSAPDITAFEVTTIDCRFEQLWLYGYSDGTNIATNGGIAFDIHGGRTIIDDCIIEHFRIGAWIHSTSEDAQVRLGNANGFIVRDTQFFWCIDGLWTRGGDANAGSVMNCQFTACRRGITEQSFLGNYYASNLIQACPWEEDPHKSDGYGMLVPQDSVANYSTFVANYIENDSTADVNKSCLVVGGGVASRVTQGERIGLSRASLIFQGDNPDDKLYLGAPHIDTNTLGWFQRGSDAQTYARLEYLPNIGWRITP
ncbi:MAG TPA: hypothetical protein PKK78_20145 [Kouleothrix sp.]|jgi:hypothetical protein|nr:hypothetical protein [Kouleothrix sp.]